MQIKDPWETVKRGIGGICCVQGTVEVKSFEVAVGSLISCRSCSLGLVAFTFLRCGIVGRQIQSVCMWGDSVNNGLLVVLLRCLLHVDLIVLSSLHVAVTFVTLLVIQRAKSLTQRAHVTTMLLGCTLSCG